MLLPYIEGENATRDMISVFEGFSNNERCSESQYTDGWGMSSDLYPLMAPREKRVVYDSDAGVVKGMHVNNGLVIVKKNGNNCDLIFEGTNVGTLIGTAERQLCSMGAYVVIWPDKKRLNTQTRVLESLSSSFYTSGDVEFQLCKIDGVQIVPAVSASAPPNPQSGSYWLDTSIFPNALKVYSQNQWVPVATSYTKIIRSGIGANFNKMDVVTISGVTQYSDTFNTDMCIWDKGNDFIIVTALISSAFTNHGISITREPPDMDYICEHGNRIWGCSSAKHEIYASKLGDPRNFKSFIGTAADAYAVTVGTEGDFTGCAEHGGSVVFFKERYIHKLYGTAPSNYQVSTSPERGVQAGCHRSIKLISGVLFYKSFDGVCMFEGSYPRLISNDLGMTQYTEAEAGVWNGKYFLNAKKKGGLYELLVYDTTKNIWSKEDAQSVDMYKFFVEYKNRLFFYDAWNQIIYVEGSDIRIDNTTYPLESEPVSWLRECGKIGLDIPDTKYISQLLLRFQMEKDARLFVDIEYDSSGEWENVLDIESKYEVSRRDTQSYTKLRTQEIPIIPRRCDHLRLRLRGLGGIKIFSITKKIEVGGEI